MVLVSRFSVVLFFIYSVLITIVSMNLLIGMMAHSFSRTWARAEKLWWLHRCATTLSYEENNAERWMLHVLSNAKE